MPDQDTTSSTGAAQKGTTASGLPLDADRDAPAPEPRSYADGSVSGSSLAPPAAGEVPDDMDEGDALAADGVQQGGTHSNRPAVTERQSTQGPRTVAANRDRLRGQEG